MSMYGDQAATLHDKPREGQILQHQNVRYRTIREGLAHILVPESSVNVVQDDKHAQSVFYNPIQQFNRDLSVLAIKVFGEDFIAVHESRKVSSKKKWAKRRKRHDRSAQNINSQDGGKGEASTDDHVGDSKGSPGDGLSSAARQPSAVETEENDEECDASEQPPLKKRAVEDIRSIPTTDSHNGIDDIKNVPKESKISYSSTSDGSVLHESVINVDTTAAKRTENGDAATEARKPNTTPFSILDALSATGLRALRYALEIPFVTHITANDLSSQAVESIKLNLTHNRVDKVAHATNENAIGLMYDCLAQKLKGKDGANDLKNYTVIDLDPYGTAMPFIDGALQSLTDGGLLCVTCTDAGVFASNGYPEKTFALYGGTPTKGFHSHEGGLRLIIQAVSSAGARYGIAVEPLLSLSIDFYARLFLRVRKSPADVKFLAGKTMTLYSCDHGCGSWTPQLALRNRPFESKNGSTAWKYTLSQAPTGTSLCQHCGFKTHLSGPMYGGPLHNTSFIRAMLEKLEDSDELHYGTVERMKGMLSMALDEAEMVESTTGVTTSATAERKVPPVAPHAVDPHPFFFIPSALAGILHCQAPGEAAVRGALKHAGYVVSRSHTKRGSVRTNAPWSFVWHMMREWIRQKAPIKEGALKPGVAGYGIVNPKPASEVPSESADEKLGEVVFDESLGKDTNKKRLVRYQMNPEANWGPMHRARKG